MRFAVSTVQHPRRRSSRHVPNTRDTANPSAGDHRDGQWVFVVDVTGGERVAPAIKAEQLTKAFRTTRREPGVRGALRSLLAPQWETRTVVEDVSFHVEEGELLALLGPNGAGKSTTIKMLTGILTPTSGRAEVCGLVPHEDREPNSRNIGAVFGQRTQLWWDLLKPGSRSPSCGTSSARARASTAPG